MKTYEKTIKHLKTTNFLSHSIKGRQVYFNVDEINKLVQERATITMFCSGGRWIIDNNKLYDLDPINGRIDVDIERSLLYGLVVLYDKATEIKLVSNTLKPYYKRVDELIKIKNHEDTRAS
jgi:hypothetical protein